MLKAVKPLFLGIFLCLAQWCFSQDSNNKIGFDIVRPHKKTVILPFKIQSNLVIISGSIDNSADTLNFILDSGASQIYITDPIAAKKLKLNYIRSYKVFGAGELSDTQVNLSVNHNLHFRGITGFNQNILVIDKDILFLSEYL